MQTTLRQVLFSTWILTALSACGGGGTSGAAVVTTPVIPPAETQIPDEFLPQNSGVAFTELAGSAITLAGVAVDSGARETSAVTGSLDLASRRFTLDDLSGLILSDRSAVVLNGGGGIGIGVGVDSAAVRYVATPATGGQTFGVLGEATRVSELTPGTAQYVGEAEVTLQDDVTLFILGGRAEMAVTLADGGGTVTTTLSELSGRQTTSPLVSNEVTDVATLEITGSTVSGTTFTGGDVALTSDVISPLSDTANVNFDGVLLGPAGAAAGAVFVIDDEQVGTITAFGAIRADRR